MSIGGNNNAVNGISLTAAELAEIYTTASGTVTFGDSSQTGNITFATATPATTAGAATVVVQSTTGPGQIILDDTGSGTGLNGNGGTVTLTPGTGGVVTPLNASGTPLSTQGFNATGLTLSLSLNFVPTIGTQLTVVNNTATPAASHPIIGTFTNLPQGGMISATYGGTTYSFQANYAGGDGNDLVLTAKGGRRNQTTVSRLAAFGRLWHARHLHRDRRRAYSSACRHCRQRRFLRQQTGTTWDWAPCRQHGHDFHLDLMTGVKTFNVTAGDTITAVYSAGTGFVGSSGTTTQTVTAMPVTVTAAVNTKTYDGTTTAAATPTLTPALVAGDTATFAESYATKNAGTGLTLMPSVSIADGNGGANYAVTLLSSTAGTITARAITVTAVAATKVYDGTTSSSAVPTITAGGLAGGDAAAFSEVFTTKNVGSGKTLAAAGSVSDGNGGSNYVVSFVDDATAGRRPGDYGRGGRRHQSLRRLNLFAGHAAIGSGSLAAGDTAAFSESYDTPAVGMGKTLTPAGSVNDGNSGGNYAVTSVKNAAGTIVNANETTALVWPGPGGER